MLGDFLTEMHCEVATATMLWLRKFKGLACPLMVDSAGCISHKYNSTQAHVRRSFKSGALEEGPRTSQAWQGVKYGPGGQVCCGLRYERETGAEQVPTGLEQQLRR